MVKTDNGISLGKASKKYGIPKSTLHHWAARGLITVVQRPELRGQALLVDEGSVIIARETYTPYWRRNQEKQFRMMPWPTPENTEKVEQAPVSVMEPAPEKRICTDPEYSTRDLFNAFQLYNSTLAARTVERYRSYLTPFVEEFPILPLDPGVITSWIANDPKGAYHKFNRFRDIRTFYNWLERDREIPNPMPRVRAPKQPKPIPRFLTNDELDAILNAHMREDDRVMIELFITTGIRDGELCSIKREDIMLDTLQVRGKTGERIVPLIPEVREGLLKLADLAPADGFIFRAEKGKPLDPNRCTKKVKKIMKAAGLTGRKLGPHTFRHTFGHIMQKTSGDLVALQSILGHTQISTTRLYAQLAPEDVRGKFNESAPHTVLNHFKKGGKNANGDQVSGDN